MFKNGKGNGRGRAYRRRLERGSRLGNNHQREENPGFRVTGDSPAGEESTEIPGFYVIGVSSADDSTTTKPDVEALKAAQEEIRRLMPTLKGTSRNYRHILREIEEVLESISGDKRMKLWLGKWKELGVKKATTKGAYLTCLNDIHEELSASIEEAEKYDKARATVEAALRGDQCAAFIVELAKYLDAMGLLED